MSEDSHSNPEQAKEQPAQKSAVEALRDEFQEQFSTMQKSFDSQLKELKTQNENLTKENAELQRALIRSATSPAPTVPETPKTEEQMYQERIDALAKKTMELMK